MNAYFILADKNSFLLQGILIHICWLRLEKLNSKFHMKSTKNTGSDGWYLHKRDGQRMLSWYFQEHSHVLQLQNTHLSWNLGTVHCAVTCVVFSPKSSERWWLQKKLSDTSHRELQPAIPHNNHLTSQIRATK